MSHRALAQRSESAVAGRFGAWNREGNTFVHVDAVQRGGVAYGVTLLSFDDDRRLQSTLMAERATHVGDHWVLEQVKLTRLESGRTATEEVTLRRWDTAITPQLLLAFWRKLLQPLATLGLVLVAMSFIFGPLREGTMGARIFVGVIVGVVFRISQDFFGPASLIFGYDPLFAALVPIAVCWLGGTWLLWRRA